MLPHSLFRSYDVRGLAEAELTTAAARVIARSYVAYAKPKKIIVGRDCRLSSPALSKAVIEALTESGVDVIDIGLVSTDVAYFACWFYQFDGAVMVTASHMPKEYNGLKFLRLNESGMLVPIGKGQGMEELETIAQSDKIRPRTDTLQSQTIKKGTVTTLDVWPDFVKFTRSFVVAHKIKPLRVVMDAGSGMAGVTAPKVFAGFPLTIVEQCFTPDGHFPNHPANPLEEANRQDIMAIVVSENADLGIAWDADCDRVYFINEKGEFVHGDFIIALLAKYFLAKHPGRGIVYDLRASRVVPNWISKMGGVPHSVRVGHSYIKKAMRETDSIFGGEISGHYYFSENAYMENGFAPALVILEIMSDTNKRLSELVSELGDYNVSGELNYKVPNITAAIDRVERSFAPQAREVTHVDGVSFEFDRWRFNVRPSANDPVLRLTLEADSRELVAEKVQTVRRVIETF